VALKMASTDGLQHVAARVKRRADDRSLQRSHGYAGPLDLTVAVGGVAYEAPSAPPDAAPNSIAAALLAAADSLMYRSKRHGGVHVAQARFTDKLEMHSEQRLDIVERRATTPDL